MKHIYSVKIIFKEIYIIGYFLIIYISQFIQWIILNIPDILCYMYDIWPKSDGFSVRVFLWSCSGTISFLWFLIFSRRLCKARTPSNAAARDSGPLLNEAFRDVAKSIDVRRVPKGVRRGENRTSDDASGGVSGWITTTGTSMVMAVETVGAEEVMVLLCSELCWAKYLLMIYQVTTMSGKRRHEQRINMIVNKVNSIVY